MTSRHPRTPALALAASGILVGLYLAARPYGDAGGAETSGAAAAFASPWWLVSHLAGASGLAALGLAGFAFGRGASQRGLVRSASALLGAALVLPYYGAETFALHIIGRSAEGGHAEALALVADIREQPVAMTTFGLGLLLLAASTALLAAAWQRETGSRLGWPLAAMVVLLLAQYYLPPEGRVAYGVVYAVAALAWSVDLSRRGRAEDDAEGLATGDAGATERGPLSMLDTSMGSTR